MKVLIADDEEVSRHLLKSSLQRWGYEVVIAIDGLEALHFLESADAPHLAILDWLMPGMDGVEVCRQFRHGNKDAYTYIILLTSRRTASNVVEGLDAGADDYLTKPFNPLELQGRLRAGKRIITLLDQLVTAREAMRDLSLHDGLTGLWNRTAVFDILNKELARAGRQQTTGVVLADIDHFKQINDTYGHLIGDDILRKVAGAWRAAIRPYDAIGRYGGEEFLAILPGCDRVNAMGHAERLRTVISQLMFLTPRGAVHVTASFGVAAAAFPNPLTLEDLIRATDDALYQAKRDGRNRVAFAEIASPALPTYGCPEVNSSVMQ